MKLLAFTDLHTDGACLENIRKKAKQADLLVCCGDFAIFTNGTSDVLEFLDSIGKKVLLIHGNHEDEKEVAALCKDKKNIVFMHKKAVSIDDIVFLGYGGEGFAKTTPGFEIWSEVMAKSWKDKKTVLLVHQPPYNTKVDYLAWAGHVGNKSFRKFIDYNQPRLVLCGHLHETFDVQDKVKNSIILNPGPEGRLIDI